MSAQDREKFLALKQRNKELEMQMESIKEVIAQLKTNESAADSKIKALNNIHSEKIRSLMNSIQLLKKENMQLEKLQKEHKRSELISQLQKDVSDQDTIIETLRDTCKIRNITEEVLDAAIIEALTKGPPRIRALTREELKIEIKKLKAQVDGLKKNKANSSNSADNNKQNNQNKDSEQQDDEENELNKSRNKNNESMMSQQHEPADSNENLIRRLEELKSESDELRLHLKASEQVVERYEQQLESKSEELNDLKSAKTDFLVLTKKYETLQLQFEQLKTENNKKFMSQYDKELKLEEMEIVAKTQSDKLKMQEENLQLEIDSMSAKLEDAVQRHDQTKRDYEDLRIRYETLNTAHQKELAKNKELNAKFSFLSAEHEKLQVKYKTETNALTRQIDTLTQKLSKSEEQIVTLSVQVEGLNEQVNQLTIENEDYKTKIIAGQGLKFEGRNWAFGREGINDASAETKELREKIRALSDKEVDLLEQLDNLKEQKRFHEQKQLASQILGQKDKIGGIDKSFGQDAFKKQQINIVRREYETKLTEQRLKIKELQEQIEHLTEMFTWVGQEQQQPKTEQQRMKDQEGTQSIIINESDLDISRQQSNGDGDANSSGISDLKKMEEKIAQGENKALKLKLAESVQRQNDLHRQIEYYRQQSGQNNSKNDQIRDERLQEMKIFYQKKVKDYQEKITQLELKEINLNEISSQISDILSQRDHNISPSVFHNLSSDVFLSLSDLTRLGDQNNLRNQELNPSLVDSRISDIISRDEKHQYSREIDSMTSSISNISNLNKINQKSNKKALNGKTNNDNNNIFQKTTQKEKQPFSRINSDIGLIIGVGAGQNQSSLENLSISSGISSISRAANNPSDGNKNNKKDFRIRQNSNQSVNSSIGSIINTNQNNKNNYQSKNNSNDKEKKDDNLSLNLDDVSSNIDDLDL